VFITNRKCVQSDCTSTREPLVLPRAARGHSTGEGDDEKLDRFQRISRVASEAGAFVAGAGAVVVADRDIPQPISEETAVL
jgi:hypothetical protein